MINFEGIDVTDHAAVRLRVRNEPNINGGYAYMICTGCGVVLTAQQSSTDGAEIVTKCRRRICPGTQ